MMKTLCIRKSGPPNQLTAALTAPQLTKNKSAEYGVTPDGTHQYHEVPTALYYLLTLQNNFNSPFTKTPIINQFPLD